MFFSKGTSHDNYFSSSQFTENNIVNEEQRRLHIDSFYCRGRPRKATNHCLCFFWKLFIYVMMMGSFLVFFIYLIIGDAAKMSDRPMKNSRNVFRLSCFKY